MHNVVLAYMPGMGVGSAAAVAAAMRVSFTNIKLALVVAFAEVYLTIPMGRRSCWVM